jgi:hypothetical protein
MGGLRLWGVLGLDFVNEARWSNARSNPQSIVCVRGCLGASSAAPKISPNVGKREEGIKLFRMIEGMWWSQVRRRKLVPGELGVSYRDGELRSPV